jgi:cation diffusion facilitator family transporter
MLDATIIDENTLTLKTLNEDTPAFGVGLSGEIHQTDIKNICWQAFWTNIGLAVFKILVGFLEQTAGTMGFSQLLIIDGLTSAAVAMSISIILFGRYMSQPQTFDEEYPYGKGKAQYIGSLLVGTILSVAAAIILGLAFKTFFIPMNLEPVGLGLNTTLVSIAACILLIQYIKHKNRDEHLEIMRIIKLQIISIGSSVIVCNSLLLTGLLGWFFMERIGSLSISLLVVVLSFRIIRQSLDGIMDRSGGEQLESSLMNMINEIDGVQEVNYVRTRHAGHNICVDIQVSVNGDYPIRDIDALESRIRKQIYNMLSHVNHMVTIRCLPA